LAETEAKTEVETKSALIEGKLGRMETVVEMILEIVEETPPGFPCDIFLMGEVMVTKKTKACRLLSKEVVSEVLTTGKKLEKERMASEREM